MLVLVNASKKFQRCVTTFYNLASRSAVSDSVAAAEALPADDVTWLDAKMAEALREENSKYDEEKENLLVEINKLRETVRLKNNLRTFITKPSGGPSVCSS